MQPVKKPTRAELLASAGKTTQDLIAPNLRVLFCGINPGLYSGYTGYHFAKPGNRFWPTLYASGFTERLLAPAEEQELLRNGLGITSLVPRATAGADDLTADELIAGGQNLVAKVKTYRAKVMAILRIGAYRIGFARPPAVQGRQPEPVETAELCVLP